MDQPLSTQRGPGGGEDGSGGGRRRTGGGCGGGRQIRSEGGKKRKMGGIRILTGGGGGAAAESAEPEELDDGGDSEETDFTLLIPGEFVGSLIGRAGSTIKRLQWQAHTTIRCSGSDDLYPGTSSRKVTLTSNSAAALDAAQSLVLLTVAQEFPDTFREVGIVIHDSLAGRIIGRSGDRISRLRESSDRCEMTPQDGSEERMLIISGDVIQITRTVRQVIDFVMEASSGA